MGPSRLHLDQPLCCQAGSNLLLHPPLHSLLVGTSRLHLDQPLCRQAGSNLLLPPPLRLHLASKTMNLYVIICWFFRLELAFLMCMHG